MNKKYIEEVSRLAASNLDGLSFSGREQDVWVAISMLAATVVAGIFDEPHKKLLAARTEAMASLVYQQSPKAAESLLGNAQRQAFHYLGSITDSSTIESSLEGQEIVAVFKRIKENHLQKTVPARPRLWDHDAIAAAFVRSSILPPVSPTERTQEKTVG